jgi:hypothetical protein
VHPASERFLAAVVGLLWSQWTAIGVAGVAASQATIVDPEALVVGTAQFGRRDPRLFDEMLDWLVTSASIVDLARLKRLAAAEPSETAHLVAAVSEFVAEHAPRRPWSGVAADSLSVAEGAAAYAATPLFGPSTETQTWGSVDPVFARHGFARNIAQLRSMSRRPDASLPAAVRFRARALVGVGAKAEVLTYLWSHDWTHGRLIAERAAYNKTAVADYLAELSAAQLVSRRQEGRKVLFRAREALDALGRPHAAYVDWARVLRALAAVWSTASQLDSEAPDYAQLSTLAGVLQRAADDLTAEGFDFSVNPIPGWANRGERVLFDEVERLARHVEGFAG